MRQYNQVITEQTGEFQKSTVTVQEKNPGKTFDKHSKQSPIKVGNLHRMGNKQLEAEVEGMEKQDHSGISSSSNKNIMNDVEKKSWANEMEAKDK